ncbi:MULTISPECIES: hypothetical protein [unclassified Streptomyces]|uniref:hypothetical protein n=1 Tax=unclassified Streptomyces TaxID=2593676 RepID=UPI002252549A|nr:MULTISPECIES: hypothetical protein [unclassified Streptomyces]MCX5335644.1 hypothetical protein [Streptomyces sp. NBC_00140]MCX5366361.1 hypothetical protein [Streptomyces sp. NBC_00124]
MLSDDTYVARRLHLLGEWDAALAALDPDADPELRAEIAVDRWFFRIEGHEEAEKAVAALDPTSSTAHLLTARLAYSRLLFQRDARPDDRAVAEAGYRAAVESGDEKQRAWAEYHWAVLLDNIDEDTAGALPLYETALEIATKHGDGYFESYIIRHLAPHKEPAERIAMLRRSLHLRAALGARPQTIAAQALLADSLPENDPERAELMRTFRPGAEELRIGWLLSED